MPQLKRGYQPSTDCQKLCIVAMYEYSPYVSKHEESSASRSLDPTSGGLVSEMVFGCYQICHTIRIKLSIRAIGMLELKGREMLLAMFHVRGSESWAS